MATHSTVLAWRIPGSGEPGQNKNNLGHSVRFSAYHSQDIPKFCYLATNWAFYKLLFLVHDGRGGYIGGEETEQKGINRREKQK